MDATKLQMVTQLVSAFIMSESNLMIRSKDFRTSAIEIAFEIADEIETIEKEKIRKINEKNPEWQMYNIGYETVERVMKLDGIFDLESEIRNSILVLPQQYQATCLGHMSTLLSNITLNRLDEFGKEGEERAFQAKTLIRKIINDYKKL